MLNKNQLYDKKKVITGLLIFLLIISFPMVYNLMADKLIKTDSDLGSAPELELTAKAKAAKTCVRDTRYMKTEHMQLLDEWREAVVREGQRVYVNPMGKSFNMSLSNTCMDCHSNKEKFCDKCHNYASVNPYCWDCHIDNPTKEKK